MADHFGIVGVLATADVVFTRLFKYIKGVKKAEKEVLDLAAELEDQTDDGETLLSIAVMTRGHPIVRYLLQSGATPHRARSGYTALDIAAELGDLEVVKALLKHGFDPLEPGSYNRTPLSIAKSLNWVEVVSLIEAFIADNSVYPHLTPPEICLLTICSLTTPIGICWEGAAKVSKLSRRELKYAIDSNNLELCRRLVSEARFQVEKCPCCGSTNAILYSLEQKKEDIALYLLEAGLKIREKLHREHTAVHLCVVSNLPRTLNRVLDMCLELLFLSTNVHPLHIAVLQQRNECLKIMLEKRIDLIAQNQERGGVDLRIEHQVQGHHLISIDDLLCVEISLDFPSDAEIAQNTTVSMLRAIGAQTAIQCAAYTGDVEAIHLLLNHGVPVDQESTISLSTALSIAAERSHTEAVHALIAHGASTDHFTATGSSCAISVRSMQSQVSWDKLVKDDTAPPPTRLDRRTAISFLVESPRVHDVRETIKYSQQLTEPDVTGSTALHCCWDRGPAVMTAYILNSGLDLSGSTRCFGSALNFPWYDDENGLLRRLLRRLGRDQSLEMLNVRPEHVDTPLYTASVAGQIKILRLLLAFGADVDLIGGRMGTPLIAAASYGRLHIVKELINAGAEFSSFCPALDEVVNVFDRARNFPEIQHWLLVGRWMERSRIGWVEATSTCERWVDELRAVTDESRL